MASREPDPSCPNCGRGMCREEADIGVGIMYGPWGCLCGYSEDPRFNRLSGTNTETQERNPERWADQWGNLHHRDRLREQLGRFGVDADEIFEPQQRDKPRHIRLVTEKE